MANPFSEYLGGTSDAFSGMLGGIGDIIIKVLAGVLLLVVIIVVIVWRGNKKRMNIPVTIWIPRSDGKIIDEISNAKGGYFKSRSPEGITSFRLKRKGLPTIEIPPPNSRFLVGLSRKLYLIQKGPDDFEPVLPESFRYVTTSKGRRVNIVDLKAINQDATAWVEDNRESARKRFTLHGFWDKYKDFIQITIFIFIVLISMYVNYQGLEKVVMGLKDVANTLARISGGPIIT